MSCSLGSSAGSSVLSAGSMGLLARACSRGGVWLDGGRRVTATLMLAAGAQMAAAPAWAACGPSPTYNGETLNGTNMDVYSGEEACNTTINDGGLEFVHDGGVANDTKINDGGTQYV
ncbi:MAG: AIDA repeat-containing protein, partial [Ottowia sp.]|nr:AIDA repeat-containing protein [Ottowia sp.]